MRNEEWLMPLRKTLSYPHVRGRLDSETSIEKEGRKPENVYGLPLTGGKRGDLVGDVADTGANCYGNGC